jgi:hypothetical protein
MFRLGCLFGFMLEFFFAPERLAFCVVDCEPREGFLFAERPAVVERTSDFKGLFVPAGAGDRSGNRLEVFGEAVLFRWLLYGVTLNATFG